MPAPMLPTNETFNITGMYSLFQYVQTTSSDLFFPLVLFGIFIIVFITLKPTSRTNSTPFAGACFLNLVLSIILRTLGFLSNKYMYLSIILIAIAVIWLRIEKSPT